MASDAEPRRRGRPSTDTVWLRVRIPRYVALALSIEEGADLEHGERSQIVSEILAKEVARRAAEGQQR